MTSGPDGKGEKRPKEAKSKAAKAALAAELAAARSRRAEASIQYEEATENIFFTKDFNTALDAIMRDRLATVVERVMAWIKRYSWGEYSLWAIGVDGWPRCQRDCEAELGIKKRAISKAVVYLQKRGYLANEPKLLYPVIAPVLGGPDPTKDEKSPEWATFVNSWKVAHSTDFHELEVARATVVRIRKVVRSDYKIWKKSQGGGTNAADTLLETCKINSKNQGSAAVSPFEHDQKRVKAKLQQPEKPSLDVGVQTKAQAREYLFAQIAQMQKSFPKTSFASIPIDPENEDHQKLINLILAKLQHWDDTNLVNYTVFCAAKFKGIGFSGARVAPRQPGFKNGPEGLGLLVNWADDYARIELGGDRRRRELVQGAGNE